MRAVKRLPCLLENTDLLEEGTAVPKDAEEAGIFNKKELQAVSRTQTGKILKNPVRKDPVRQQRFSKRKPLPFFAELPGKTKPKSPKLLSELLVLRGSFGLRHPRPYRHPKAM